MKPPADSLNADDLTQYLHQLAEDYGIKTWCLAYSGGVDSQVLLHLLHQSRLNIRAVYIDHGLQAESSQWAAHCAAQCHQLHIPFQSIKVNARAPRGESPEAAARHARYAAFREMIDEESCLLTAQHQQDQAETVMLQLLRGGGAAGLAAMPRISRFGSGWHSRPLLDISQQAILDYAKENQLSWVEDPSNQQQSYDRNYLRHRVMPQIQQRWPALNRTLALFAQQQAEDMGLLEELARIDLQAALICENQLDLDSLRNLHNARLRNALRFWIRQMQLALPSRAVLQQIVQQMLATSHDTRAVVNWANVEVRRYRNRLYCLQKNDSQSVEQVSLQAIEWHGGCAVELPGTGKKLRLETVRVSANTPHVLDKHILDHPISIRFRQGGERIQPAGRKGHHELKKLFQEAGVPPWERDTIPLLYIEENLIAVAGYWLADKYLTQTEEGLLPVLESSEIV